MINCLDIKFQKHQMCAEGTADNDLTRLTFEHDKRMHELSKRYIKSDDIFETIWGEYIYYNYIENDGKNDVPELFEFILENFEVNMLYRLLIEIKKLITMHEKEFINFAKSDNLFSSLSFSEDHDENMRLLVDAAPLIGRRKSVSTGSGRRQKRKNKVKYLPWNDFTNTCPPNETFIELITNNGKKIAKKSSNGWIDKNGEKLECKIIKWRINEK